MISKQYALYVMAPILFGIGGCSSDRSVKPAPPHEAVTPAALRWPAEARREQSPAERGAFLVRMGGCTDCHTPMVFDEKIGMPVPDQSRYLSGHPEGAPRPSGQPKGNDQAVIGPTFTSFRLPFGTVFTANLTPHLETGLGNWTEDMFIGAVRTGRHMGGTRPSDRAADAVADARTAVGRRLQGDFRVPPIDSGHQKRRAAAGGPGTRCSTASPRVTTRCSPRCGRRDREKRGEALSRASEYSILTNHKIFLHAPLFYPPSRRSRAIFRARERVGRASQARRLPPRGCVVLSRGRRGRRNRRLCRLLPERDDKGR